MDQLKHSMKCPTCSSAWPVDILLWTVPEDCPGCKDGKKMKAMEQFAKYKELYLLLTVKREVEFDQVCEMCVVQMEEVYSDR